MVKKLAFVAMGNSLTVGFIPTSLESHPYSTFLREMAKNFLKQFKNTLEIRFINKGVNGDLTGDMLLRFKRDVIDLKPDYVIILSGTNDIGWGFSVDDIFVNLKRMFKMAKDNNIGPIGCTVPSILGWDDFIPPRLELNKLLTRFCHEEEIPCVDLFFNTCDPKTNRLRPDYSSDGLHLNRLGYKKLAEAIFEEGVRISLTSKQLVYEDV